MNPRLGPATFRAPSGRGAWILASIYWAVIFGFIAGFFYAINYGGTHL